MGLYERMMAQDETKIAVHTFAAAAREVARGNRTLADLISVFELDAEATTELTAIRDHYVALTAANKPSYLILMEDAFILATAGLYTKQQVKSVLGF